MNVAGLQRYILTLFALRGDTMLSPGRPRKQMLTQQQRNNRRRRANPRQLAFLRKKFSEDPKPDQAAREKIGRAIDMTPRSVQIWFQNNRAKTKDQERKFTMHGKLYTMTTRACSENVSCVQAGGGDAGYAAYEARTYNGSSTSPYRFYTPPPSRPRYADGRSSNWWEAGLSHPDLSYGIAESQKAFLPHEPLEEVFSRPRAHSTMNVSSSRVPYPTPRDYAFSFTPAKREANGHEIYLSEFEDNRESVASLDVGSPISIIESPGSEGYDLGNDLGNDLAESIPDLHSIDPDLNYDVDFSSDATPGSVDPNQSSVLALTDFAIAPDVTSTRTQEPHAFAVDYGSSHNDEDLDTLVHALDLRAPDDPLTATDDFIRVPCSLARIGQYLCEDGDNTGQALVVQYSTSQQVLQIVVTDNTNGRVTIMEKDVLHFPPSRSLQKTSFACSQIDVEVFGAPRIRTEDFRGQKLRPTDPTNGEISTAHQCRLFGDFDEQLAMMQKLETADLGISGSWLVASDDVSPTSQEPTAMDSGLLADDGIITSLVPQELEASFHTSHAVVADHYYR